MKNSFFILSILLVLPVTAAGQSRMQGVVVDSSTLEPVAGAVIKLGSSFTSTRGDGRFRLALKPGSDSVTFRCMGYESLTLAAKAVPDSVMLTPKATLLNDVIVQAPDIYARGDTLVFNVAKYATAKDNAIIDVIKRLPGIKVEEDGTIKYQGKPISKFYLDGNDFIGGQYGLATNNISYKDVKSVEVMENHQPIKALEGIEFPEEAGINLKLKEDARGRVVGVAEASVGFKPLLYDGSVFAMRLSPKYQNLFTVKADNTGWNPATHIKDHDFSGMFASGSSDGLWPEYISADNAGAPLQEKRTRDNLSWLANGISAWKRGDTSMRLKLNYMADRLDFYSGQTTDYLDSDIAQFTRHNTQRNRSHDLSIQFNAETNKREYYMKNRLKVGALWSESASEISGSYNVGQNVRRRSLGAVNDLKLIKKTDKRIFTLTSSTSLKHRPDRLVVSGEENSLQSFGTTDLRTAAEVQFGRMTRFWKYYITAGADLDYHRINSSLSGIEQYANSGIHNAFLSDVYVTPQADYDRNLWRLSLKLPVKWLHHSLDGQRDYINTLPRLSVNRRLNSRSEISASAAYRLGSLPAYLYMDAPVLSDFRNIFAATRMDGYTHGLGATLSYRYRNPLKALFFNLSASYSHSRSGLMSNQLFEGDYIVSTFAHKLSRTDTWSAAGGVSKGLGHSRMVAGCEFSASLTSTSVMRNDAQIDYRQIGGGVKPYFKGSLTHWLSVNLDAEYSVSALNINGDDNIYHSYRQNIFATLIPNDLLNFTVGADYYLTRFPEGSTASLLLADASAVWRVSGKTRLTLTAGNLFDRQNYRYVTYGTLSRSEYYFKIRGRNILATLQLRF